MSINSAGARFRAALQQEKPLQIMGTVNAYAAMMARTDALQKEGLQGVIDRACACVEAGADAFLLKP